MADDASDAWPTGITPAPGSLEIEPAKVDALCTWGPAPKVIWQTIPYAIAVAFERQGLLREMRAAQNELSRAEKRRDQRLAALGERLLDTVSLEPRLRAAAEAAKAAIAESVEVNEQQRQVLASVDSQISAYEQALTNERHQLQALNSQLQHCRTEVEQADLNLKREQARLQRLDIERRNLEQAEAENPELPAKLESHRDQARALAPRIESAERTLSASRSALQHIQASANDSESHARELQRLIEIQARAQSAQLRTVSIQSESAEAKTRAALADVGRAVLASAGRIAVESSMLAELRKHDEEVGRLSLRRQILVHALENYDRPSTKTGLLLIVAAIGLFALGVLYQFWR